MLFLQWDLVCDRNYLVETSQSVFNFGVMVGAIVFTSLADCIGRKPVHLGCQYLMFCISLIIVFTPNYITFVVLRFLHGAVREVYFFDISSAVLKFPTDTFCYDRGAIYYLSKSKVFEFQFTFTYLEIKSLLFILETFPGRWFGWHRHGLRTLSSITANICGNSPGIVLGGCLDGTGVDSIPREELAIPPAGDHSALASHHRSHMVRPQE